MRLMLLLVPLVAAVAVGIALATRRTPALPADGPSARLRATARMSARWRIGGLVLGVAAAAVALHADVLGRGVLLSAPVFALCVLVGVVGGELRTAPPVGPVRSAVLEVRRVRDYVPRRLARAVLAAVAALVALVTFTTAIGSADDLGRAGRSLARQCSPVSAESHGPWPGSYYSLPLAAVVAVGLLLAGFALSRVVQRPRQREDVVLDDGLRREAAAAVTAAAGLLVAVPLAGVGLLAGAGLLGIGCRPVWWSVLGTVLLLLVPAALVLGVRCAVVLAVPFGARSGVEPEPAGRP